MALTRRFGGMISTRAGLFTRHLNKIMIFAVLIKAFRFVIEESQARAHLLLQSYEK
jgi:hypothetical protein